MAKWHRVQPGEHLSRIAQRYGFADSARIWEHPENRPLRDQREDPNVLAPGDRVYIPDLAPHAAALPSGQHHRFRVKGPRLKLRLQLQDVNGNGLGNKPCRLIVEGVAADLQTDAEGLLEQAIPITASRGSLCLDSAEIPLLIGALDPVSEMSGQRTRLANLGYLPEALAVNDALGFSLALEEFQCDQELPVTGQCDAATADRLLQQHGC